MKLNKNIGHKQKILIGLTINLVTCILIAYFFVFSYLNSVISANTMLINNRIEFETKLIKEEKFSKISKNLSIIEDDVKKIDRAFIDENKKLEFITMFESMAENNEVNMEMDISFDKINPKDKSIPLNLVLRGNYNNLLNFLIQIENLDIYINIENLEISDSKTLASKASALNNLPSSGNLTMTIGAKTFWR